MSKYIETEKIELKEILNDSFVKEIESFLNTDGGVIYIGVRDNGEVIGVDNLDETFRKISDIISDQIEPNAIDCVIPEVVYEGNKLIIKVNVKKGYGPLYCIKKYGYSSNGCHLRVGTTCKSMTLDMIRRKFESNMNNYDLMTKRSSYLANLTFTKLKMMLIDNEYHIDENSYQSNLKLKNSDGEYNQLAELLADKNNTPFIFAKFKGKTKAAFSERSDYGNQCIVLAYEKMRERLLLENICKIVTDPRPRRDIYLYDMKAVNEALINAIVHNDYRITNPQVSFYEDRLEIVSHGGLPVGLTQEEFFMGISRPRNEGLMDIFTRLGIVEHAGHGIPIIVETYGKEVFDIKDNLIRVVIPFNEEVIINHGKLSNSINGETKNELSKNENRLLEYIEVNPTLSAKEFSTKLNIPYRSVQRYISNLQKYSLLSRVGAKKNGYYVTML